MDFIQTLKHALSDLPGEHAHLEMFPLRAKTSDALKTAPNYKLSGVMALVYPAEKKHWIVLTERQTYEGNHSGQMSFPGGKLEPYETTSLEAALRETYEEIGIDPAGIEVLGRLSEVYIPVSNFLVHPYVGFLKEAPVYRLNEREVKTLIAFELDELLRPENRIVTNLSLGNGQNLKNVPAFWINEKIIWGATALMLNEIRFILMRFQGAGA